MALDESILEQVAINGEMDYAKWPSLVEPLVERLNHIVYNEWPIPSLYPIINPVLPSQRQSSNPDQLQDQQSTLVQQTPNTPRTLPPVPPFPGSSASNVPDSQPPPSSPSPVRDDQDPPKPELPAETLQQLNSLIHTLRKSFSQNPPHTIQRLAELTLQPSKHYRNLPAWLRALDRVIAVSSTADVFPLDEPPPQINGLLNGSAGGILFANSDARNSYDKDSLGSDESLGGALLTPIPWLKDQDLGISSDGSIEAHEKVADWQDAVGDMLDEPLDPSAATAANDAIAIAHVADEQTESGIPGRPDGAVTQGELIRMEQEAGIVPVPHEEGLSLRLGDAGLELDNDTDSVPHARGPDVVGTVDMGLVEGQEHHVRISSPPTDRGQNVDANDAQEVLAGGQAKSSSSSGSSDGYVDLGKDDMQLDSVSKTTDDSTTDGDIVLVDADGTTQDAPQADPTGQADTDNTKTP